MGSFCEVVERCPGRPDDRCGADPAAGSSARVDRQPCIAGCPTDAVAPDGLVEVTPLRAPVATSLAKSEGPRSTPNAAPLAELRRNADAAMAEMEAVFNTGLFGTNDTPSWVWTTASPARCSTIMEASGTDQGSSCTGEIRWATHFWDTDVETPMNTETPR
mmetsp:Transcript_4291/g.8690  ORF Transcript_4291/g.8690 Transcript_4291/m.8690 type:complete len:161 (+) Transcript_4291:41-523(+)